MSTSQQRANQIDATGCLLLCERFLTRTTEEIVNPVQSPNRRGAPTRITPGPEGPFWTQLENCSAPGPRRRLPTIDGPHRALTQMVKDEIELINAFKQYVESYNFMLRFPQNRIHEQDAIYYYNRLRQFATTKKIWSPWALAGRVGGTDIIPPEGNPIRSRFGLILIQRGNPVERDAIIAAARAPPVPASASPPAVPPMPPASASSPAVPPMGPASASPASAPRTSPTGSVASTASTARERVNQISADQCLELMRRFLTRTTNEIINPVQRGREISVYADTFRRALTRCRAIPNISTNRLSTMVSEELFRRTAWSPWARADYPASVPRGNEDELRYAFAQSTTAPTTRPQAPAAPVPATVSAAILNTNEDIPLALRIVLSIFDRTTLATVLNPATGRQISPSLASGAVFYRYFRQARELLSGTRIQFENRLRQMIIRELYGIETFSEWSHNYYPGAPYNREELLTIIGELRQYFRAHQVRGHRSAERDSVRVPQPHPFQAPVPPASPAQPPVVPAVEAEITPTQAETIAELTELLPFVTMEELQVAPAFLALPPNAQLNLRRDWYLADPARGAIPNNLLPSGQPPAPASLARQNGDIPEPPVPTLSGLRRANGIAFTLPSRVYAPIQLLEAQLIVYYVTTSRNVLPVDTALGLCEAINNYVFSIFRNMRGFHDRRDLLGAQLPVVLSVIDFAITRQTERTAPLLNALRRYIVAAFAIGNRPARNFAYFIFSDENDHLVVHDNSPSTYTILNNIIQNNPDIVTRVRELYATALRISQPPWFIFRPQRQPFQQSQRQLPTQQGPVSVSPQKRSSQKSSSLSAATLVKYATSKCNDLLSVRTSDTEFQEINGAQVPARIPIINESNVTYYNSVDGTPLKKFVRKLQKACVKLNTVEDIPLQTIVNNIQALRQRYSDGRRGHQLHPNSGNNVELKYLYQYYNTNEDTKTIFRESLNNISVRYQGENSVGIDAGGVRNHFFQSVADQLFPSGLFLPVEEASQYYTFNWNFDLRYFGYVNPPHTPLADRNREEVFKFVGKLVAFLMMNEFKYEGHYTKAIFANLLYKENNSRETNEIFAEDYPLYYLSDAPTDSRSFVTLMNTPDQIEYVGFEFNSDTMRLKPDSELSEEDNQVSARNFPEYFNLFAKHKLIGGDNAKALKAFKEGFFITRRFLRGRGFTIEMLDKLTSGGELTPAAIEAIISRRLALTYANDRTPVITKMVAGWMIDIFRNTAAILLKNTRNTIFSEEENLNKIKRILRTLSGVKIEHIRIHTYGRVAHLNNTTRTQVTYYFNVVDRTDAIENLLGHTPEQILGAVQSEFPNETAPILTNPYPLQRLINSGNDVMTLSQSWKAFIPNLLFFWTANRNYSSTKDYTVSYNANRFGSHTCFNQIDLPNPGQASFGSTFDEYYAKMIELVAAAPGFTMG